MLSTVDTYFVATISAVAISAVGLSSLISNIYLTFFIAIGTGVSIMTARADGEGSMKKVNQSIQNALILTGLIVIVATIMNLITRGPLLDFLGKERELIDEAALYFNVVILPIGTLCFMTVLSSIVKSLNDTKTPMYTALLINLVNVLLDYVLIIGIGEFKGIGIVGAGIATTTSRLIGVIILSIRLHQKTGFLKGFELKFRKGIKDMVHYAIPVGGEKLAMRIGQLFYGSLIVTIGVEHYTGHNIAGTIEAYSYLPGMGFGIAAFAIIGHAIGSKDYGDIRNAGFLSFKFSTIFMIVIGLIFYIFAPQLAGIFTDDPEIIRLVTIVLRIIAFFQPFLCSTQVIAASLQSLGDVKYPFYLTVFGIYGIRLFGTYILGLKLGLGLVGVWLSYALDVTIRGTLLFIRFMRKTSSVEKLEKEYSNI
jgi:putative MATE family efflux protein